MKVLDILQAYLLHVNCVDCQTLMSDFLKKIILIRSKLVFLLNFKWKENYFSGTLLRLLKIYIPIDFLIGSSTRIQQFSCQNIKFFHYFVQISRRGFVWPSSVIGQFETQRNKVCHHGTYLRTIKSHSPLDGLFMAS